MLNNENEVANYTCMHCIYAYITLNKYIISQINIAKIDGNYAFCIIFISTSETKKKYIYSYFELQTFY